ncbi:MAG: signal recognition particle protein [candidate division WOR-3 bacterium]|jgi:signal recognition particle subunit SRP54
MFDLLTQRLTELQRKLLGHGRLGPQEISRALTEIRTILLDADVNYKVVGQFVRAIENRLKEQDISTRLKPGEIINYTVYQELVQLLGGTTPKLQLHSTPAIISLVGLQGTGKTTLAGKLALRFRRHKPLLVACDPKRPAASSQLAAIAARAGCDFQPVTGDVVSTCITARQKAQVQNNGILILDTAGRLHIDEEMMAELVAIEKEIRPDISLLVLDGMIGQDAVNQANEFARRLQLTGCCFTKLDGDARGGAVLSVRQVTGLPIFFISTGEKLEDLEEFHPDRIAARILGMGDIKTLAEKVQTATRPEQQQEIAQKLLKGKFDLEDFLNQLRTVKKMGSLSRLLALVPGAGNLEVDEKEFSRIEAIIQSMTPEERRNPDIINGSRRLRIARGSGTTVTDVNRLLKEFQQAREFARQLSSGKMPRLRRR